MERRKMAVLGALVLAAAMYTGCVDEAEDDIVTSEKAQTAEIVSDVVRDACGIDLSGPALERAKAGDYEDSVVDDLNDKLSDSCIQSKDFQGRLDGKLRLTQENLKGTNMNARASNCPNLSDPGCMAFYRVDRTEEHCSNHVLVKCKIKVRTTSHVCQNYPDPCVTCSFGGFC